MKKIAWHAHAQERLVERGINEKLVKDALQHPDQVIVVGKNKILHKRYYDPYRRKNYLLRLFIEQHAEVWIICSVYRTSKINKYWRDEG